MANSKFPLNGRYATLGDLVHEYALASPWPTNLTGEDDTYGWDINSQQPYISLVYTYLGNDEYEAKTPYELVWFGNVYSDSIYDPTTKMHKLILADDSSVYGFDRYIIASKISDNAKIAESGIPFRFIIPDKVTRQLAEGDDQFRYCYNYKQDNGEATVMYTLQCIIDLLDNLDKQSPDSSAYLEHKSVKRFLFGLDDHEAILNNTSIIETRSGETVEVYRIHFFNASYVNSGYVDVYPIFIFNHYDEILEVNKTDNRLFVKPDAYTFLGSYYYTEKNVWYYNYTSNNAGDIPSVWEIITDPVDYQDPQERYWLKSLIHYVIERSLGNTPTNSYINPDLLKETLDGLYTDDKIIKSYLRSTIEIKLLYYTYWFLMSQRYHTSYVTSCQFVKISNMTYLPTLPVLRCDLNLQRIIEKFTITSANHVRTTMLPAGPLNEDTTITINISYVAKFKNIANETESSFEITVSFRQLRQLADAGESDLIWYRLYYPTLVPQTHINESDMGGCRYGGRDPEDATWTPFPLVTGDDDWSLRNAIWPSTQVTGITTKINKADFQTARDSVNFNNGDCYSDTFDVNTYKLRATDTDIKQHFKDRMYPPGGMLRIHNSYVRFPEEQAINSSYYFDVSILRKRNYYYELDFVDNEDATNNILVNLYYEPLYRPENGTSVAYNTPNTTMPLLVVGAKPTDHQPSSVSELQSSFEEVAHGDSLYYTINILGTSSQEAYMSVKALAGTMRYFISGDSSFIPAAGSSLTYINDSVPFTVEKFSEVGLGVWEAVPEIISTLGSISYNPGADSPVENQYKLIFTNNTALTNRLGYSYFRLKFDNINNYIYFRINDYYTRTGDTEFNLCTMRYLTVLNAEESTHITGLGNNNEVYLNRTHLCYLTYHLADIKNSNLTYTRTQIGQQSPIYYRKPSGMEEFTNKLYLKHTSVRFNDAGGHDRYIYTANNTPIYLAYTTMTNTDSTSPFYNYTGYMVESTPRMLFSKIELATNVLNMNNICSIYMSFEPITVLSVGFTYTDIPEISEMDIKYVHYRNGSIDVSVPFTTTSTNNFLKQMVLSVLNGTQVYLTPECITFKLNGVDSNLADPALYESFSVGIEYSLTNGQWSNSGSFNSGLFNPQYSEDNSKDISEVLPTWTFMLSQHIKIRITFNRKT